VTSRTVRTALVALVVVQLLWYLPRLPATVASHFDASGRANGWMSREAFVGIYVGVVALLAGLFAALRLVPTSLWNLPDRDYWLAPERRDATMRRVADTTAVFANATLALMLATFELAFRANLPGGTFAAGAMWLFLAAYGVFVAVWLWKFVRAWSRPR
jgi:uncharacterized membrane protein